MNFDNEFKNIIKKHSYLILLLGILLLAFWIRAVPARYNELQALDPFYMYRAGETILNNNMQIPDIDLMREYPLGKNGWDFTLSVYFPPLFYLILFSWLGMSFFQFALIYPAIMGALAVLVMFFVGKEIHNKKTGLLSAFFLATIPAFLTRTTAGFIEKEPVSGFFILLTFLFFIRAFKRDSWVDGIIAGVFLAICSTIWRGVIYIYAILALFIFIMLLLDKENRKLIKSYIPTILLGSILSRFVPLPISLITEPFILISYLVFGIIILKLIVEKYNLIKKEQMPYFVPGLIIILFVGLLMSSMFFDFSANFLNKFTSLILTKQDVAIYYTVAENRPGDWGAILSTSNTQYSSGMVPALAPISSYFSVWIFMLLSIPLIIYEIYKHKNYFMFLPLVWLILGIWGVFYVIRLLFLFGIPAALLAGYFIGRMFDILPNRIKFLKADNIDYLIVIMVAFVVLLVSANAANAYVHTMGISPSICFTNPSMLIDGKKCLETDESGNIIKYAEGQPWYEAMTFLREETPEDSNILSWWDFGYWFQTRGKKNTVADGGYGPRYLNALWFTRDYTTWEEGNEWLRDKYGVDYILMDYTLPGKYGAITAIASKGKNVQGFLQFSQQPTNTYDKDNQSIIEYKAGQYTLWIPYKDGSITGPPALMQSAGNQYVGKTYINELCTEEGIIKIGDKTPSTNGCLSISSLGIYFIPQETKNKIFTNLMFMEGANVPVKKVFDNNFIKIYKVEG